jgi:glycine oxidase
MSHSEPIDVVVVGGGIVGLSIAWRAGQAGMSVTVLERDRLGAGASHVAAGMLAPVAEVEFGDAGARLLELGLRSAAMWPAFAAELQSAAGASVGLTRTGTLLAARDDDDARELERQLAFRQSLGLAVRRLRPSAARQLEPALAPTLRLALEAPDDHSVDPRLVLDALARACVSVGAQVREHAPVARVELDAQEDASGGREDAPSAPVSGLTLLSGERVRARQVVLAAGAWTEEIEGLPAAARVPVRPVKGQILRLRDPAGPGLLRRVLRFRGGYVVPRADGRYVLGATVEERGFSLAPTAGGVYELLRDAHELLPGIGELEIEEVSAGLRPGTPDNAPAIGASAVPGLIWATGHYRNGVLLAPITAELVRRALARDARQDDAPALSRPANGPAFARLPADAADLEALAQACAPARFASGADERRPLAQTPAAVLG